MAAGLSTPLLDFFRRGEVARDVRVLAAHGAIAPRPLEQLGILMLLTGDHDLEVRSIAEDTLSQLPPNLVADFIARADVPAELREFFTRRGIAPSNTPAPDFEEPFLDRDESLVQGVLRELREETGKNFPERVTAFRDNMAVHGKYRKPCPVCGSPVQRIVYAENETNYCAPCQTGGKLLADRGMSRLLKQDWPRSLEELEERLQR